jgi:hypothetical protein
MQARANRLRKLPGARPVAASPGSLRSRFAEFYQSLPSNSPPFLVIAARSVSGLMLAARRRVLESARSTLKLDGEPTPMRGRDPLLVNGKSLGRVHSTGSAASTTRIVLEVPSMKSAMRVPRIRVGSKAANSGRACRPCPLEPLEADCLPSPGIRATHWQWI